MGPNYYRLMKKYPEFVKWIDGHPYISDVYIDMKERSEKCPDYTYDIMDKFSENEVVEMLASKSNRSKAACRAWWNRLFSERKGFYVSSFAYVEALETIFKESEESR